MKRNYDLEEEALEEESEEIHTELDTITVSYPNQKFSPYRYHNFDVGGIFYKTIVKPGETPEEAYERAWDFVDKMARDQYIKVSKAFKERYQELSKW